MADDKKDEKFVETEEIDEDLELPDGAAIAKEIQEDINQQMQIHFSRLENDVRDVFSQKLESIESSLSNQLSDRVLTAQSDILKTNKIFREICRPLGARWKELFLLLTEGLDKEKVEGEIKLIEKQSPLMQPYKSLMSWKELKGTSFVVDELTPALRSLGLSDLVDKVDTILHRDSKDDLFDLSSIGKSLNPEQDATPGASSRARETPPRSSRSSGPVMRARTTSSESGASAAESSPVVLKDQNLEAAASSPFSPPAAEPASPEGGALDDRHLLFLAKKIGDFWDRLAKELKVPKEDVSDIMTSEGSMNYQGAFRMLWIWRESRSSNSEGSLEFLTSALEKIGRPDLISILKS